MKKREVGTSIFVKLILLIVTYGVLMNIAVALFINFSTEFKPKKLNRKYFTKMDEYLVKDLGTPPDTNKARNLSNDLNIGFRYKYLNSEWSTSQDVPTMDNISGSEEYIEHSKDKESFTFHFKDKMIGIYNIPEGFFILSYPTPQDTFNPEKAVIALVVLLSVIFVPLYFLLSWLLSPLKSLSLAVEQIGDGNYEVELPVKRMDEFGEFARSLREMSSRVRDSIRAKEQLLVDVSHELRTPLTRIKFGLELNTPKEKINEDVTEIDNMIKKILEYYRNEYYYLQLNLSEIELVPLIENVIASYDLQKNRIEFLNYLKNKEKIVLNADEEKLKIVFRNLINNALKFSPENKNIIICLEESDKQYIVSFRDYGEGIDEDQIYKIFEPFSRIDSSRSKKTGGYGLGLAIVKKIIDLHGGTIEVKSTKDEGTEMIIKLKK
jgi:signal transduction histidine kinase